MRVEAIRCSARENNHLLWMLRQCPVSDFPVQHIHARYTQKREPLAISLSKDGITFDRSYAVVNTTQRKRCVPREQNCTAARHATNSKCVHLQGVFCGSLIAPTAVMANC